MSIYSTNLRFSIQIVQKCIVIIMIEIKTENNIFVHKCRQWKHGHGVGQGQRTFLHQSAIFLKKCLMRSQTYHPMNLFAIITSTPWCTYMILFSQCFYDKRRAQNIVVCHLWHACQQLTTPGVGYLDTLVTGNATPTHST